MLTKIFNNKIKFFNDIFNKITKEYGEEARIFVLFLN